MSSFELVVLESEFCDTDEPSLFVRPFWPHYNYEQSNIELACGYVSPDLDVRRRKEEEHRKGKERVNSESTNLVLHSSRHTSVCRCSDPSSVCIVLLRIRDTSARALAQPRDRYVPIGRDGPVERCDRRVKWHEERRIVLRHKTERGEHRGLADPIWEQSVSKVIQ